MRAAQRDAARQRDVCSTDAPLIQMKVRVYGK
jgi:hypothetical protein